LPHREPRKEARLLKDVADFSADRDAAAIGFGKTRDATEHGRFTAAACTEDRERLAATDGEIESVEHGRAVIGLA